MIGRFHNQDRRLFGQAAGHVVVVVYRNEYQHVGQGGPEDAAPKLPIRLFSLTFESADTPGTRPGLCSAPVSAEAVQPHRRLRRVRPQRARTLRRAPQRLT